MPIRLHRLVPAILGALLALPGVSLAQEEPAAPSSAVDPSPLASPQPPAAPEGRWQVVELDGYGEGLAPPIEAGELTLWLLDDGLAEGTTGCGRFNAGWSLDDGRLSLGVAPTGHLGCGEQKTAEAVAFSTALGSVSAWRPASDGDGLELVDDTGRVRVVLAPVLVLEPTGVWTVTRYARADGSLVKPDAGAPMAVDFEADGSISGSTGCRPFEGTYWREGQAITIGPIETVGPGCEQARRRPERRLLAALGEAYHWQREDEVMTLLDAFDQPLLVLRAAAADEPTP